MLGMLIAAGIILILIVVAASERSEAVMDTLDD